MVLAILLFCLIQRTACVWVTNYAHINRRIMFIFKSKQSVSDRCLETLFCKWFTDDFAALRPTECAASLPLTAQNRRRERRHCAGRVRPRARGAVLETSSKWTIAKVFFIKVARFVSMYLLWEKSRQKGLKVTKYCAKVALLCVRCGSWWQRVVDIVAARHK